MSDSDAYAALEEENRKLRAEHGELRELLRTALAVIERTHRWHEKWRLTEGFNPAVMDRIREALTGGRVDDA